MSVVQALKNRVSTRAFLNRPVAEDVLREIFTAAQLSPSNCNVQPWQIYVVSGGKKDLLKEKLIAAATNGSVPNPDFDWAVRYEGVHQERQYRLASDLYGSIGIARNDKQARNEANIRNWSFFDAPHAAFFTMNKYMGIMGGVDLGIYAQSLSLLLAEKGIASCFQGALGQFPDPIREFLELPSESGILFGMSFGYADETAPVNNFRSSRVTLESAVSFVA